MRPVVLLFVFVPVLAGCSKELPAAAKIDRPALTLLVGAAANADDSVYSGEIRARYDAQLSFRVGGKIIERLVEAGTPVKAGQALMRLDPLDSALQLDSAQALHHLAEAEAVRYRELRAKGFISQSALDAKEAALTAAQAQLGLARNQASYSTLLADRAGVVAATLAEVGQVVSGAQPVLRLAPDGEREVAIAIPEAHLAKLKVGAAAEVYLMADDKTRLSGRLRVLSPAADPASRTYAARVSLSGNDAPLGMTARVRFAATGKSAGLLVPLGAIFQQGKQMAVWVVAADRTLSLRQVTVAAYRDDGAVISGGIAAGERIVSNGVHRLAAGEIIRIIESAP